MRTLSFIHTLRRFWQDQKGLMSAEAALMMPLLLWAHMGIFTFFDGFRTQNVTLRAAYTISDLLSRETDYVTPSYMNGLNDMLGLLTQSKYETMLRVTVVRYDLANDDHILVWSEVDGGLSDVLPLTQTTLESKLVPRIPAMGDADSVIIVETWSAFMPIMNFGIDAFYMENMVVTRPRFAPQLLWEDA